MTSVNHDSMLTRRRTAKKRTVLRALHRERREDTNSSLLAGVASTRSKMPGSAYLVTKNLRATTRPACVVEWLGKYPDGVREIRSPSLTRKIGATYSVLAEPVL